MADMERVEARPGAFGDAAVDGLIAGGLAGIPMALFLVVVSLITGEAITGLLSRFAPGPTGSPVAGVFVHLAVAGVYGLVYGLARRLLDSSSKLRQVPGWLTGMGYGVVLWLAAHLVVLPSANSALRQIAPPVFLVAHLIYGLGLGLAYRRR